MRISEMRDAIRLNIDDVGGDLFTDAQINSLIKRAFIFLYRKIIDVNVNPYVTSVSLTISANTRETNILPATVATAAPSTLQRAILCLDPDSWKVPILDMEACIASANRAVYIRRNVNSFQGYEEHYLGYYRIPSTDQTFTLYYIPKITGQFGVMPDDTEYGYVPVEHHDVVINYATVLALGKDEINARFWFGVYTESLSDMLATIGNEAKKYQGVVDVTENEEWL